MADISDSSQKTDPLFQFGRRLVALRQERGWSQEKLALESGIARSYLSEVERGIRNIALLNICRLAETLGLEPAELLKWPSKFGQRKEDKP